MKEFLDSCLVWVNKVAKENGVNSDYYVGTRLISELNENVPGVYLKETLSKDDKETLSELMSKDELGALIFIEVEDENSYPQYYLSAKAYKEDEL